MEDKKILLSIKDLDVKFKVRGRVLTAIRGVSLDLYENESVAIVGESGSGKSVLTKTFAGMLDANGYISNGSIIFDDDELADTYVDLGGSAKSTIASATNKLNKYSKLELGADIYKNILELESEFKSKESLSDEDDKAFADKIADLTFKRTELYNHKLTIDASKEKDRIKAINAEIATLDKEIEDTEKSKKATIAAHKAAVRNDVEYLNQYKEKMEALKSAYNDAISGEITEDTKARNEIIAKEIYLSVGRYSFRKRMSLVGKLLDAMKTAMTLGVDLYDDASRNAVFDNVVFRVAYIDETPEKLHGKCILNLSKIKLSKDWTQIRGKRIATVFQDPMTSLNPIVTIGKQITSIILKHQECSEVEARKRALILMKKVGIPNAEKRFDDYPFQYSGGMRQRIVIAIALCCQPKILICDEPTTALDVTIQAQILKLLKDLQKEFNYTIVFITHDLGVVANVADRVAVLYAGQVIELGTVEEVFYDPRHPYTWALLSSLPQLAQRNTKL